MWTRVALLPRRHNVCATVLKWRVYFLSLVCFKSKRFHDHASHPSSCK